MRVLVTGGTHGMGKGLARALAVRDGAKHEVIILCRSRERALATMDELRSASGNARLSYVLCDLAKLDDVRRAAGEIRAAHSMLDAIFVNAGIGYAAERVQTEDGMDAHFQVNYLSQFMLCLKLLHLLEAAPGGGRIIFNASRTGAIGWEDLQMERAWGYEAAIGQAMAAKRMFAYKLHRLYQLRSGNRPDFICFQIHKPVWSNQISLIPLPMRLMASVVKLLGRFISIDACGDVMAPLFCRSKELSAADSGRLITWKEGRFEAMREDETVLSPQGQDRLWEISLKLCGDEDTVRIARRLATQNEG